MKWKQAFLKGLAPWLWAAISLSVSNAASAATLTLTDWTTLPFPSGADHADTYSLPFEIALSLANPITQIEIDYQNNPFVPGIGIHEIKSAAFLFQSGDLASTTVFESTTERFWARIVFRTSPTDRRLTALADPLAPAFVAFHGSAFGSATTSATWTATYLDGSTRIGYGGIIPEPNTAGGIAVCLCLAMLIRKANRTSAAT